MTRIHRIILLKIEKEIPKRYSGTFLFRYRIFICVRKTKLSIHLQFIFVCKIGHFLIDEVENLLQDTPSDSASRDITPF